MRRSLESLLNEAAQKRADVRVKPRRAANGNLVFVAHLHGVRGETSEFLVTGNIVTPIEAAGTPMDT